MAGLCIIERHSHSFDIYNEETRFTPLGSDATVVYGFKDLRIQNTSMQHLRFRFAIAQNQISLTLEGTENISMQQLSYKIIQRKPRVVVQTINQNGAVLVTSVYKRKDPF